MKTKLLFILFSFVISGSLLAQEKKTPKLIVGIVVDQMRADYLQRFYNDFSEDGFKQLINKGFYCQNVHYNYKPTSTAPGHASIFTGTTPSTHGIVGNYWYSDEEKKSVYCVKLLTERGEVSYSPKRLLSETFADGMKQFSGFASKSFGISLKDRGAILPAGHLADGAYWFSSESGKWVSSEYYEKRSPEWLQQFNEKNLSNEYLKGGWKLSNPIADYSESAADNNNFEFPLSKKSNSVFPYDLIEIQKEAGWGIIKKVPQGNQLTADLAKEIIIKEELGKRGVSDFLSISFSATDYIGHTFGVQSVEVQDTYIKLDQTMADLLQFLDAEVGDGNYLLFLTSDHGASYPRNYLKENNLPGGEIDLKKLKKELKSHLESKGIEKEWVKTITNLNLYFNEELKQNKFDEFERVKEITKQWLLAYEGIAEVLDASEEKIAKAGIMQRAVNGVHPKRSGDLVIIAQPNWNTYSNQGSTHGSAYTYDTHVPLLFYGTGIKQGKTAAYYPITSIIPSISVISGIPFQNSSETIIIKELVE